MTARLGARNAGRVSPAITGKVMSGQLRDEACADEVLHPIGKIQPLLIGWNLPDQVEPVRTWRSGRGSNALDGGALHWIVASAMPC